MIRITKVSDGYRAHAEPPSVSQAWDSEHAMTARELMSELVSRGAHPRDVADAFSFVEPNWQEVLDS